MDQDMDPPHPVILDMVSRAPMRCFRADTNQGNEMRDVTVVDSHDAGASPVVRAAVWPGGEGALTVTVAPGEKKTVHLAVSGTWSERANATLALTFRDANAPTKAPENGSVAVLKGTITHAAQFVKIVVAVVSSDGKMQSFLRVRPSAADGAFLATIPTSWSHVVEVGSRSTRGSYCGFFALEPL